MSLSNVRGYLFGLLTAFAVTATGLATAGTAHADVAQDYAFYSTLEEIGFHMWDPPGARAQGLAACADMALGSNWRMTVTKLMNIGYTLDEASMMLGAATVAYCPGLDPRIQDAAPAPEVAPAPMQLA